MWLLLCCPLLLGCDDFNARTIVVRLDPNDPSEVLRLNAAFRDLARERNMQCVFPNEDASFYVHFSREKWIISTCNDFYKGRVQATIGESDDMMYWEIYLMSDGFRGAPDSFYELGEEIQKKAASVVGSQRVEVYPHGASLAEIAKEAPKKGYR